MSTSLKCSLWVSYFKTVYFKFHWGFLKFFRIKSFFVEKIYDFFFYYKNKNVIHQSIDVNKFSSLLGAPNTHTKGCNCQSKWIRKDSLSNLTLFLYFLKKILHLQIQVWLALFSLSAQNFESFHFFLFVKSLSFFSFLLSHFKFLQL